MRVAFIADIAPYDGFKWMGTVACGVSILGISTIYFPMWGGMFLPAKSGYTEEDYYFAEYTEAEREQGLHLASSKFVSPCPGQTLLVLLPNHILHFTCPTCLWDCSLSCLV